MFYPLLILKKFIFKSYSSTHYVPTVASYSTVYCNVHMCVHKARLTGTYSIFDWLDLYAEIQIFSWGAVLATFGLSSSLEDCSFVDVGAVQ